MSAKPNRNAPGHALHDSLGLERLIFFSDAVFAIAITLLVLEIRLPAGQVELNDHQLLSALLNLWPKYLAYIVSFLVIASVWLGHHRRFRMIQAYDRRLLLINLLLLMAVAFIPFPTSILSEYGNRTATIFYALSVLVMGVFSSALWSYAANFAGLVREEITPMQIRQETLRGVIIPTIFLLSIVLAFLNNDLAKFSWILIAPWMYVASRRVVEQVSK